MSTAHNTIIIEMSFSNVIADPQNIVVIDHTLKYKKPMITLSFKPCMVTSLSVLDNKNVLNVKLKNRKISFKDKVYIYEIMDELKIKVGDIDKDVAREQKIAERPSDFFIGRNMRTNKEYASGTETAEDEDACEKDTTNDEDRFNTYGVFNVANNVSKDIFVEDNELPTNLLNNIVLSGIKLTESEIDAYYKSINVRCSKIIKKYLDYHKMDIEITYEDVILTNIRKLLKNGQIDEIEKILKNILENSSEMINNGPYEVQVHTTNSVDEPMCRQCFYVEDESCQKIILYDSSFKDLGIKASKHQENMSGDVNLATITNYYPMSGKLFCFTLRNKLYVVKERKIIKKLEIKELRWINNHKIAFHDKKILLVGGSRNLNGIDEYNTIIEIKLRDWPPNASGNAFDDNNDIYNLADVAETSDDYEICVNKDFYPRTKFDSHLYGDILIVIGGKYGKSRLNFIEYYHLKYKKVVNQVPFPLKSGDMRINSVIKNKTIFIIFSFGPKNLLYAFEIETFKWEYIANLGIDLRASLILGVEENECVGIMKKIRKNGEKETYKKCQVISLGMSNSENSLESNQPSVCTQACADEDVYTFYILKASKRYKVTVKRRKKSDLFDELIIKLRSYFFLLEYNLEYAQRKIFPLVQNNEKFYRMLMIKCYLEEKVSYNDIFEELSNFFVESMRMPKENIEDLFK
ncbi:putative Kelch-type beta propeller protein [Trachipleistophora hominis]|uniref:Putative Kelch-type beta propeller protein n=1 Tax=Trachipleistophora hominis TaxID=72359 RepID=L7JT73_TRAHO|nr:putative Kelch-type beta propeller protein [Trachipleistophora hominis]